MNKGKVPEYLEVPHGRHLQTHRIRICRPPHRTGDKTGQLQQQLVV